MNPLFKVMVDWLEARYPAIRPLIEAALPFIDANKIAELVLQALHDWQSGMDFWSILRDLLAAHMPPGSGLLPTKAACEAQVS